MDIIKELNDYRRKNLCSKEEALNSLDIPEDIKKAILDFSNNKMMIDVIDGDDDTDIDFFIEGYDIYPSATFVVDEDTKISSYGKKLFKDILYRNVELSYNSYNYYNGYITVEEGEEEKCNDILQNFLMAAAGYVDSDLYDKIFSQGKYEKEEIFDEYDEELIIKQYGQSFDADYLGANFDKVKEIYYKANSKEEFEKLMEEID